MLKDYDRQEWMENIKNEIKKILPSVNIEKDINVILPYDLEHQELIWYDGWYDHLVDFGFIRYNNINYKINCIIPYDLGVSLCNNKGKEIARFNQWERHNNPEYYDDFYVRMSKYIKNDTELKEFERGYKSNKKIYYDNDYYPFLQIETYDADFRQVREDLPLSNYQLLYCHSISEAYIKIAYLIKDKAIEERCCPYRVSNNQHSVKMPAPYTRVNPFGNDEDGVIIVSRDGSKGHTITNTNSYFEKCIGEKCMFYNRETLSCEHR